MRLFTAFNFVTKTVEFSRKSASDVENDRKIFQKKREKVFSSAPIYCIMK